MSNTNTGGPAFPMSYELRPGHKDIDGNVVSEEFTSQVLHGGMTLRDYLAAKAMQIMWDAYDKGYCGLNNQDDDPKIKIIAEGAYQLADAMLRAREGGAA